MLTALILFALFLPILGPFLGAFAVTGANLALEHIRARHERTHLAKAGNHLHPLPEAHFGHLAHEAAYGVELGQELLNLLWLATAPGRDSPPPALVDHVWVAPFL